MKLYLKKLLHTLLFLGALVALYAVFAVLLQQFLFWFEPPEETIIYISLILSTIIMLYIVYLKRWENKTNKAVYLEMQTEKKYSFKKDLIETLKTRENFIHLLAFVTIDAIQTIPVGIASGAGIWRLIFGTILAVTPNAILFLVLNTLVWCIVHKQWHRSRFSSDLALETPL